MAKLLKYSLLFITLITFSQCAPPAPSPAPEPLTPEQQKKQDDINKDYCGYLTPTINNDCYTKTTNKSQCCVISWNGKKACMPQSSTYFKDKRADFTIDNTEASIMCGQVGENIGLNGLQSTFFGSPYCGKRNSVTTSNDCKPVGLETNCCYLYSKAYTTKQNTKELKVCINEKQSFNETVVAQTLFPGTDTVMTCYDAAFITKGAYVITKKNSMMIRFTFALVSMIILFLF